jgi:hypothetical protein
LKYLTTLIPTFDTQDDPEGWQYGIDFNSVDWFNTPDAPGSGIVQSNIIYYLFVGLI